MQMLNLLVNQIKTLTNYQTTKDRECEIQLFTNMAAHELRTNFREGFTHMNNALKNLAEQ